MNIQLLGEHKRYWHHLNLDKIHAEKLISDIRYMLNGKLPQMQQHVMLRLDDGIYATLRLGIADGKILVAPASQFSKDLLENHYAR